jgi:lysozyme
MTLRGMDTSLWQEIDWPKITDIDFVYFKSSEGNTIIDSHYAKSILGTTIPVWGTYHYFRPALDVTEQAYIAAFLARGSTLPLALDVEARDGISPVTLSLRIKSFLNTAESLLHYKPIIYTGPNFWDTYVARSPWAKNYKLWISNPGNIKPLLPKDWTDWFIFQNSYKGSVPGIPGDVDMDVYEGNMEQFLKDAFSPPEPNQPQAKVIGDWLRIRVAPNVTSGVTGYLRLGMIVTYYETIVSGDYVWLRIDGGYACKTYKTFTYMVDV